MSATADKSRYFLEQSVPELKEFERKQIFTSAEIASIAKKRSDFEHKINARGSSPTDYARYAEFEINVDTLRRKRVKRLGIKSTTHNGQRRVLFVFDRATRKFPGDIDLWMQSIEYTRRQKAYKKLSQTLTNVLRLHPTKPELWIYAAKFALEDNADMTEARSYMQRGLRFCKASRNIWIEYVRLELVYMAKIHMRRQILGIGPDSGGSRKDQAPLEETEDLLHLPKVTAEDVNPHVAKTHDIDEVALQNLDQTPVMSGVIPIAIFDAAMVQFDHDSALGHQFFDLLSEFGDIPVAQKILSHILDNLHSHAAGSWHTAACSVAWPLIGKSTNDTAFASALRTSLQQLSDALQLREGRELTEWCRGWLQSLIEQDIDPALRRVIESKLRSLP